MEDIFVKKIQIKEVRHLKDVDIPISDTERKHLIITGKNGSGKTSVLNQIDELLRNIAPMPYMFSQKEGVYDTTSTPIAITMNKGLEDLFRKGEFIVAFLEAKRNLTLQEPKGIERIDFKPTYGSRDTARNVFIQYIVNLKADRSFARDSNELDMVKKIDDWFEVFEKGLRDLFESDDIKFEFDRKTYNFYITEKGKEPYNLNQLSDGYAAILSIITELIMRMEKQQAKSYDMQGIVLIDEIETHLHIELQKLVLPFLTSFFPKMQFIVSTHSPFVLSSVKNAVVCDLEKRIVTDDLSGYSYEALVENYFDSDKYSTILKQQVEELETLAKLDNPTTEQKDKLAELSMTLNAIPKFAAEELAVKLQQIQLLQLNKKRSA